MEIYYLKKQDRYIAMGINFCCAKLSRTILTLKDDNITVMNMSSEKGLCIATKNKQTKIGHCPFCGKEVIIKYIDKEDDEPRIGCSVKPHHHVQDISICCPTMSHVLFSPESLQFYVRVSTTAGISIVIKGIEYPVDVDCCPFCGKEIMSGFNIESEEKL